MKKDYGPENKCENLKSEGNLICDDFDCEICRQYVAECTDLDNGPIGLAHEDRRNNPITI